MMPSDKKVMEFPAKVVVYYDDGPPDGQKTMVGELVSKSPQAIGVMRKDRVRVDIPWYRVYRIEWR